MPISLPLEGLPVAVAVLSVDGGLLACNAPARALIGAIEVGAPAPARLGLSPDRWAIWLGVVEQGGQAEARVQLGSASVRWVASQIALGDRPAIQIVAVESAALPGRGAGAQVPVASSDASPQRLDSLGVIAGGIAHDFNNLLVGVLAEASAAREDEGLGDATRDALRRIEAAAGRMSQLTRQLLAYAGRGRVATVQLDPDRMLGELRDQLARIVEAPAVLELAPGADAVVVEADPHLLRQVVINLVANAHDAAGRRVVVASRRLSRDSGAWWQLEVSDDGVGIDPHALGRIFDPFFSTKPDRHGLGLSAVHGIVRRMGGDVEVDSTPGLGTRFRVRLPVVVGAAPPPRADTVLSGPIPRLAGLRVLVVDDEPSVRATVRRLLERRGATVAVAVDGVEGEALLRAQPFELMIADVTMPGRTGYDLLELARATFPRLPVILMSGYTARVRGEGGEEEPDAFVEKPFTAKTLDAAIDEVLRIRGA